MKFGWVTILIGVLLELGTATAFSSIAAPAIVKITSTSLLHQASAIDNNRNEKSNGLQDLKDSIDIVDVVESYQLKRFQRHGSGATCLCPFHDDHSPSLSISRDRQMFRCFSCNAAGDVFKFVDQYSKLPGQKPFDSFRDVVKFVNEKFGDGTFSHASSSSFNKGSSAERERLQYRKSRIKLANAAAATYFSDNLVQPFAGAARFHLMDREIQSRTIVEYALGFAPDAYYGNVRFWGDNSLVEYLKRQNFTAEEIIASGLAVRTKGADNATEYSNLMDRFRNRLMVPIFDETGTDVLGFGGRELPVPTQNIKKMPDYKVQRYLNSPETLLFEKKKVLFGLQKVTTSKDTSRNDLIVVEGYMDAISLSNKGIQNAVATMGTAVSPEQLSIAARAATMLRGRVIFCFDSDQAGTSAIERLCTNGMLRDATRQHAAIFAVAQLPIDVKDPAEFMESRPSSDAAAQFQAEVLDTALDWTDWYIQQIMSKYVSGTTRGGPGSFSDVFERIAEFLASSMERADRTRRAYEIAGDLARVLADEQNKTEVSSAVHVQLESDLIELVSSLSNAKDAVKRRAESLGLDDAAQAAAALVNGMGPSDAKEKGRLQLSSQAKTKLGSSRQTRISKPIPRSSSNANGARVTSKRRRVTTLKRSPMIQSLTPHFGGFQFKNRSDRQWLGIDRSRKSNMVLGKVPINEETNRADDLVYFNSDNFNGHHFLSDEAVEAGYTRGHLQPDRSLVKNGIASLVRPDASRMILSAENSLLRLLLSQRSARTTVRNMLEARSAIDSSGAFLWTCPEKEWLFDWLVSRDTDLPQSGDLNDLRCFLAALPDVPDGAFSKPSFEIDDFQEDRGQSNPLYTNHSLVRAVDTGFSMGSNESSSAVLRRAAGSLDRFFVQDSSPQSSDDDRVQLENCELVVQDVLTSFLSASTAMRVEIIKKELSACSHDRLTASRSENSLVAVSSGVNSEESALAGHPGFSAKYNAPSETLLTDSDVLSAREIELMIALHNATKVLRSAMFSSKRISSRLMDENIANGADGRISVYIQKVLASKLDDHFLSVSQRETKMFGKDHVGDPFPELTATETSREALERMADEWGDWFDDDYVWSPRDGSAGLGSKLSPLEGSLADHVDEESLEDFFARVEREYKGFDRE